MSRRRKIKPRRPKETARKLLTNRDRIIMDPKYLFSAEEIDQMSTLEGKEKKRYIKQLKTKYS